MNKNTALVLIDLQLGFDEASRWGGNRNNPDCEKVCHQLLKQWRDYDLPIFHIRHNSTNPDSALHPSHQGNQFKALTAPLAHEIVIEKTVNSAFIGTNFHQLLTDNNISQLVLVGLTTNHCVSTTARMAGNLGFEVVVVEDATATFDRVGFDGRHYDSQIVHQISLANLHGEFATVMNSQLILSDKFWQNLKNSV
ncbi:cysteine hydrolase family protein [Moraxella catarrhalis]|uniref:Isochorismatase n=1 Tax=Moraxella catarrhalis TaxID=480 RepID=A0A198UP00_MORCA|nr:cysteine hydrolase family protein [Moraxella catarrhalis]OAU94951.1 Isochorismatase [Moraxella catarrhalis]OAU95489.1 Isochorismatase [Moraxella catarrhalis]OAU96967.1 Isochorismatase [Moraxella catarrhalis]